LRTNSEVVAWHATPWMGVTNPGDLHCWVSLNVPMNAFRV
jgi:hypothetical protein